MCVTVRRPFYPLALCQLNKISQTGFLIGVVCLLLSQSHLIISNYIYIFVGIEFGMGFVRIAYQQDWCPHTHSNKGTQYSFNIEMQITIHLINRKLKKQRQKPTQRIHDTQQYKSVAAAPHTRNALVGVTQAIGIPTYTRRISYSNETKFDGVKLVIFRIGMR